MLHPDTDWCWGKEDTLNPELETNTFQTLETKCSGASCHIHVWKMMIFVILGFFQMAVNSSSCDFQGFLRAALVQMGLQHKGVIPSLPARNILICLLALYISFHIVFHGRDIA